MPENDKVLKKGWLKKYNPRLFGSDWHRRYYKLYPDQLNYLKEEFDQKYKSIRLDSNEEKCSIKAVDRPLSGESFVFKIESTMDNGEVRIVNIACDSKEERDDWISAIKYRNTTIVDRPKASPITLDLLYTLARSGSGLYLSPEFSYFNNLDQILLEKEKKAAMNFNYDFDMNQNDMNRQVYGDMYNQPNEYGMIEQQEEPTLSDERLFVIWVHEEQNKYEPPESFKESAWNYEFLKRNKFVFKEADNDALNALLNDGIDEPTENDIEEMAKIITSRKKVKQGVEIIQYLGMFYATIKATVRELIDEYCFRVQDHEVSFKPSNNYVVTVGNIKYQMLRKVDGVSKTYTQYMQAIQNFVSSQAVFGEQLPVSVPLQSLVHYKGYLVRCEAINNVETVVYGLHDNDFMRDVDVEIHLERLRSRLNLREHNIVGSFGTVPVKLNCTANVFKVDYQQRSRNVNEDLPTTAYFLRNLELLFPIESGLLTRGDGLDLLSHRFRPEFVENFCKPLSSDYMLGLEANDEERIDINQTCEEASRSIFENVIPSYVRKLNMLEEYPIDSRTLKRSLRKNGLTCEHIGYIMQQDLLPHLYTLFVVEMVALVANDLLQHILPSNQSEWRGLYANVTLQSNPGNQMNIHEDFEDDETHENFDDDMNAGMNFDPFFHGSRCKTER
eukprot:TRINITY_DN3170_c0_g1_i4.p1 TRINITY_DN3170_c0_g1~~TRINITY_DN3170_c0_g1_i4.p1  ORF type:complete len:671 (-),score=180.44 TRINITY_DN3170_c0_g1_i4:1749-3761(-)